MSRLRSLLVVCLTLAVAALPAAGASAAARMAATSSSLAHTDCAKHVDKAQAEHGHAADHAAERTESSQARGHCADHAACGGACLCLGMTAVLPETLGTRSTRLPAPVTVRIAVNLNGPAYLPPAPPPRV